MIAPRWIAFDLNGTLIDPAGLLPDADPQVGRGVLDDAVQQAMVDTIGGEVRPFADYLGAALRRRLTPEQAAAALERLATLPPYPDAGDALDVLAQAGYRLAVVTNSAAASARTVLAAGGLLDRLEAVVGSDGLGAYKPDPRVYANAVTQLGVGTDELCLVAAHWWDVRGAQRAGWRGAWVGHDERRLLDTVPPPLVQGATLRAVADRLALLRLGTA